jgi:hypothetical protein
MIEIPKDQLYVSLKDTYNKDLFNKDVSINSTCNKDISINSTCNKDISINNTCNKDKCIETCNKDTSINLNNEVYNNIYFTTQELFILKSFEIFYNENNFIIFIKILKSTSLSIRLIDYFITKYSKNNKIIIKNNFNIFNSYKQQLKLFQKKYFDPFSRGERIPFFINNNYIITTIGQLNFFKWFIYNNIHNYVINNYLIIEKDMIWFKICKTLNWEYIQTI